jgi:ribosome recycling factor
MQEEIDLLMSMTRESMESAIDHLQNELVKLRTGRASSLPFDGLYVDYYGVSTAISQCATVKVVDARTITITPYEKSMIKPIENSIFEANMGLTPQNDGILVRLTIPALTEERRRDLVKQMGNIAEHSKVGVRAARRDALEDVKKAVKDGFSEDAGKTYETKVQQMTDEFIGKIDKMVEAKEKDLMTI